MLRHATDRGHFRTSQPIKMQSYGAQSQGLHLQNTSTSKAQGTLSKRRQKDCKSRRVRGFAVRLCFLVTQKLHTMSRQCDCFNMSWTRMTPMAVPAGKGKAHKTSPYSKNSRQLRRAGSERNGSSLEKSTPTVVQRQMVSSTNTHTITLYGMSRL